MKWKVARYLDERADEAQKDGGSDDGSFCIALDSDFCQSQEQADPVVPTTVFLLGYLLAWTGFSAVVTLLWVATITAFVLAEKVRPRGNMVGRVGGAFLYWLDSFSSASLW